ncbi:MAG: polymerase beta protein [Ignavibacteria bacterium]|nr:polymerase beta protein [Ignavibacteria bacterium]
MTIQEEIKQAVLKVEPNAEVYLFGSRARGDFRDDSDWDLLILLSNEVNWKRKDPIYNILYDVELNKNTIFNTFIYSNDYWKDSDLLHITPFYKDISNDIIRL